MNIGELADCWQLQLCEKQTLMATVTALTEDNLEQISWVKTVGNIVTFRVQATITMQAGDHCLQTGSSSHLNNNFPQDTPELHIEISPDANGSLSIQVDEEIEVNMPGNIYQAVNILLVVKEGGDIKRETTYNENPVEIERPT